MGWGSKAREPVGAIDLAGQPLAGAREAVRVFMVPGGGARVFIDPPAGVEPFGFGILLADLVHHGAKAYAQAFGVAESEALYAISAGLSAELARPTDTVQQINPESH